MSKKTGLRNGAEQRVVLDRISWSTYLRISREPTIRRGRMSYDQGVLEIVSPSLSHERIAGLIGRMIESFTQELNLEVFSVNSTTFRRKDLQRAFEADEGYYISHASAILGKEKIDLMGQDPPPDLTVEVDISTSSLNKLTLYGSMGVPEFWRHNGRSLKILLRQPDGKYRKSKHSAALPGLSAEDLDRFLDQRDQLGETHLIRSFQAWVRERFGSGSPAQ